MARSKHPMQKIHLDPHGTPRFVENEIVSFLLRKGGFDMNDLACMKFSDEDRSQFAQLIGYSTSGFGDLSYARQDHVLEADQKAIRLVEKNERKKKNG